MKTFYYLIHHSLYSRSYKFIQLNDTLNNTNLRDLTLDLQITASSYLCRSLFNVTFYYLIYCSLYSKSFKRKSISMV